MNKANRKTLRYRQQNGGEEGLQEDTEDKKGQNMETEGNQTLWDEHLMEYTDVIL